MLKKIFLSASIVTIILATMGVQVLLNQQELPAIDSTTDNNTSIVGRRVIMELMKYNGIAWSQVYFPVTDNLLCVDVVAPSKLWVGGSENIWHFKNDEWTLSPIKLLA